jgi:hypothetical protein
MREQREGVDDPESLRCARFISYAIVDAQHCKPVAIPELTIGRIGLTSRQQCRFSDEVAGPQNQHPGALQICVRLLAIRDIATASGDQT